ncbi:hypothetical protein SKAU_G00398620 [Synaphobranchus kaupii]|uniref:Uncharacterized protein n=1 Tax=Synaphobranchus kaupii TaxID=118154 RepID=A0A9Q1E8K3_SYNKA|nr:hypothetical protein SKAU_G00398620 [Synaphobranchus kaupii]
MGGAEPRQARSQRAVAAGSEGLGDVAGSNCCNGLCSMLHFLSVLDLRLYQRTSYCRLYRSALGASTAVKQHRKTYLKEKCITARHTVDD